MRDTTAPDWMLDLIERSAPQIVRMHGRAMLPASPEMLGCGSFGCVFDTFDPRWVCKVSIDGSEAFFARAQNRIGRAPAGVCEYIEPLRVGSPAGPIWIMWRQAVTMPTFDQWSDANCRPPKKLEDKWDEMGFGTEKWWEESIRQKKQWSLERRCDANAALHEIQQCGLTIAFSFSPFVDEIGQPSDFANDLRHHRRAAEKLFDPHKSGGYWSYTRGQVNDDPSLTAAIRILALQWHFDRLRDHMLIGPLVRAMKMYLDRGLVIADTQPDNVARVDGVWSVFDLGFTVPIHPRWDEAWMDEDIDTRRWDSTGRMEVWGKLTGQRRV